MARPIYVAIAFLLIFFVLVCGCGTKIPVPTTPKSGNKTPTATPTPAFGNIYVTTNPLGASFYIEGKYIGTTPLNISNISNGKYNVSLRLERFSTVNTTITVSGGKTTTLSKSLSEVKPKIELSISNSTLQKIPPCLWIISGTISNTGDAKAYRLVLTLEMKPLRSDYDTVTSKVNLGDLSPGLKIPFSLQATVLCEGDYKATVKYEGIDIRNPDIDSDDQKISGSKAL